jgi:hypothetical protein
MKKFVLVHIGFEQPTPEIMAAWGEWFESIKDITIENVGLGPAKEISSEGVKDLPFDRTAVTGYTVIKAEDSDEAVKIAQACPFITGIGLYEVREM